MSQDYEKLEKHPFDPLDPPEGTLNYDPTVLNPKQQHALDQRKLLQRKDNEIYLNQHPEIQGLISILLRHVLEKKPSADTVHQVIGSFFDRPYRRIASDLLNYLIEQEHSGNIIEDLRKEVDENIATGKEKCLNIF